MQENNIKDQLQDASYTAKHRFELQNFSKRNFHIKVDE